MDSSLALSPLTQMPLAVIVASLLPEILVASSAIILLIGGVFAGDKTANTMHMLALFVLLALLAMMSVTPILLEKQTLFSGLYLNDRFTFFSKSLLVIGSALVFLLSNGWLARPENQRTEFPVLMLFALLGMLLMVSANDLMSLYMGMELSSLALYVLASFSRDNLKSTESGIKYFILGALASGLFLFGASLVYGFSGTTNFAQIPEVIKSQPHLSVGLLTGFVLVITAFCFKISAAPFHMWTPDVYEGAPTPVTAYFSIAPKIAAMSVLIRLLIQPFAAMQPEWQQIITVAAIASMLIGAFGGLMQKNIKRMLAYSSIGHVGYALTGLATGTVAGVSAVLIYFSVYLFMSAGAFACILLMMRDGKPVESISDLAGLSRTRPRMAFALAIFMFSMAGIPPLAGFFGKMYVFLAAVDKGMDALAVIGVLSSVIACFYYLRIVKVMYFDEASAPLDTVSPRATIFTMTFCALIAVLFFLTPAPLVLCARAAAEVLFH